MAHSILSPSAFSRVIACPASLLASLWIPRQTSAAAERGTDLHSVAEKQLRNFESSLVSGYPADPGPFNPETDFYVAHCSALMAGAVDFGIESVAGLNELTDGVIPMFGTVDFWAYTSDGTLHIVDYKSGAVLVSPVENVQLSLYAIGISNLLAMRYPDCRIENVRLSIAQGEQIVSDDVTLVELNARAVRYRDAIRVALSPRPPYAATVGDHCKYCPARVGCPVIVASFDSAAALASDGVADLPNVTLVEIMRKAKLAGDVFELAKDQAQARFVETGELADGLKTRGYQPPKSWADKTAVAKAIAAIDPDAIEKGLLVPGPVAAVVKALPGVAEHVVTPEKRLLVGLD